MRDIAKSATADFSQADTDFPPPIGGLIKRSFDIFGSLVGLIALSPLFIMQKGLIAQASDPATTAAITNDQQPTLLYSLVRNVDGKTSEIAAKEETPVLPGDVIKVKLAPLASQ